MPGPMPSKRAYRRLTQCPGARIILKRKAEKPVLVASMFGNDESDVVVLLVRVEALNLSDNRV
jgi:hypothetical protein